MNFYNTSLDTYTDNPSQFIPSSYGNNNDQPSYKKHPQRPGSFHEMGQKPASFRPGSSNGRRTGLTKLNEFRNRVSEAIEMCKRESTEVRGEFEQVVGQERHVYNMLVENPGVLQRAVSYPDMPYSQQKGGKLYPYGQKPERPQQISTPFQQKPIQHISQLSQFIPQYSQIGTKQQIYSPAQHGPQNPSRKQSDNLSLPNQPTITFGSNHPSVQNLKHSLNKIKSAKELNLSENAIRMIEEIERKAFEEIERLRREKLGLMQRLNEEIKNVNEQKRKNAQLSKLINNYSNQAQRPDGSYASGDNTNLLQTRLQQLTGELQRANQLNNNLRMQLSHRGSGLPGVEQLLRQGETIRQETLRLIKLKENQGDSSQKVQELQRRLANEQVQKQAALNELRLLKQKPTSSSHNRPFQQVQSYQRSVKVTTPFNKSTTQYQDLVSQMKRITGF